MLKKNVVLYSFFITMVTFGLTGNQSAFAHHHHHKDSPPPAPVTTKKDNHLNPKQNEGDISSLTQQQASTYQQDAKNNNDPAALLPDHYRKRTNKVNGRQGWVNSTRVTGKHDMGINMPVSQTADPTQNKTHNVFRRAMPLYDPDY